MKKKNENKYMYRLTRMLCRLNNNPRLTFFMGIFQVNYFTLEVISMLRPALIYVRCADACSHVKVLIQQRNSKAGIGSVHTSAKLIFHFSNKNGKRKYYLSLSYLHILKYRQK